MDSDLRKALFTVGLGFVITASSCTYMGLATRIERLEAAVPLREGQVQRLEEAQDHTAKTLDRLETKLDWIMRQMAHAHKD